MTRELIRADGTRQALPQAVGIVAIERMIGADFLDTVNLRDGRVMLVDDQGHDRGLPVNLAATALYHSVCRPGTTHQIRGDVVVTLDADFGADL